MTEHLRSNQRGFAIVEIILVVLVIAAITGLAIWRLGGKKDNEAQNKQTTTISGSLTTEDRNKLEEAQKKELETQQQSQTSTTNGSTSTTPSTSTAPSTKTTTPSTTPKSTPTQTTPAPPSTAPAPTTVGTRPTTAFCQAKDGNSFAAWATQNQSHTYQVYENGNQVSKTETGTAGYNYDTMKVVGVIPYLNQAAWATCSDKAGYLMYYYKPTGSVYTYNWLVPFEHVSVTKP